MVTKNPAVALDWVVGEASQRWCDILSRDLKQPHEDLGEEQQQVQRTEQEAVFLSFRSLRLEQRDEGVECCETEAEGVGTSQLAQSGGALQPLGSWRLLAPWEATG